MQDRELERTWLDDDEDGGPRRTRGLLIGALTVPWLVVVVVLVATRGPSTPATDPTAAPVPPPAAVRTVDPGPEPLVDAVQVQGAWRSSAGPSAAGAVAVVTAHTWLVSLPGSPSTVEVLAVEGVEQLDGEFAVATILGVVHRDDHRTRVRLAVPVRTRGVMPTAAGDPWFLPTTRSDPAPLHGTPVDDPLDLVAASRAMLDAGYLDVQVLALERTDAWPWRVHARARTPDGLTVDTPVLLRRNLDEFVVAGTVHTAGGR